MVCSLRCERPGGDSRFKWCFASVDDFYAHVARRAGYDPDAGLVAVRIEVLLLDPVDLEQLLAVHLAHLVLVGPRRAARDIGRLLQENGRRRRLEDSRFKWVAPRSVGDLDAHVAGRAGDDSHAGVVVVSVQVLLLEIY